MKGEGVLCAIVTEQHAFFLAVREMFQGSSFCAEQAARRIFAEGYFSPMKREGKIADTFVRQSLSYQSCSLTLTFIIVDMASV